RHRRHHRRQRQRQLLVRYRLSAAKRGGDGDCDQSQHGRYVGVLSGAAGIHHGRQRLRAVHDGDHAVRLPAAGPGDRRLQRPDASTGPTPEVPVTFPAPASGASATFAADPTVLTGADGVATSPQLTANTVAGSYTVNAAVPLPSAGLPDVPFTLTNNAAAATHVAVNALPSSDARTAFSFS